MSIATAFAGATRRLPMVLTRAWPVALPTAHLDDRCDLSQSAPHGFEPAGKKGGLGRLIRCTKGGVNTKLHAVTDANGRLISLFMTAGHVSDYIGPAALIDRLPRAQWLVGDRGNDADWFRETLQAKGITPCIPSRKSRTEPIKYDKRRYKSRNRIEPKVGAARSCSAGSRTGGSSPPDMTAVRPSSSPPSLSPLLCSSGHES